MVVAIIWAGGQQKRFHSATYSCKHNLEICDETILERLVRQVKVKSQEIWIMGCDSSHHLMGTQCYVTNAEEKRAHRLWKWEKALELGAQEDVCFLYGDAFYSDEAIEILFNDYKQLKFVLRPGPSSFTGKQHKEIYGIKVPKNQQDFLLSLIKNTIDRDSNLFTRIIDDFISLLSSSYKSSRPSTGGYYLLRSLASIPWYFDLTKWAKFQGKDFMSNFFFLAREFIITIDDWTEDFDTILEYEEWLRRRKAFELARFSR